MSETKTTRKELFARIAKVMAEDEEVVEMCDKYIEQLSRKRVAKVKPEVEVFRGEILNIVNAAEGEVSCADVRNTWMENGESVSSQKVSATLTWLAKNGYIIRHEPESKNDPVTYLASGCQDEEAA